MGICGLPVAIMPIIKTAMTRSCVVSQWVFQYFHSYTDLTPRFSVSIQAKNSRSKFLSLLQNPWKQPTMSNTQRPFRNGRTEPSVDDVPKLQFVEQCFREALRLYSPVTGISRDVAYDTLLGGHRVYQGERTGVGC